MISYGPVLHQLLAEEIFLHNKYIKTQWLVQKIFLKFDAFIVHFKKRNCRDPG